jgi:hypothetical protein
MLTNFIGVFHQALLADHALRGKRRGARNGIAGVRAAHGSRILLIRQSVGGCHGRERKARRQALGHDQNVGRSVRVMVTGKQFSGPTKAGLNFVKD